MKRLLLVICAVLLAMAPTSAVAKNSGKEKGQGPSPSSSAYEHASDNAKFKRGDDWQGGQGKVDDKDDIGMEDDENKGQGKKHQDRDQDREKKKKGKKGVDEPDDETVDEDGKKKMKKSGKGKGNK
jgi:hypothetical protein